MSQSSQSFVLEYWHDKGWIVGRLRGIPDVFSEGQTLDELEDNIRDAYKLMSEDEEPASADAKTKELVLEV